MVVVVYTAVLGKKCTLMTRLGLSFLCKVCTRDTTLLVNELPFPSVSIVNSG